MHQNEHTIVYLHKTSNFELNVIIATFLNFLFGFNRYSLSFKPLIRKSLQKSCWERAKLEGKRWPLPRAWCRRPWRKTFSALSPSPRPSRSQSSSPPENIQNSTSSATAWLKLKIMKITFLNCFRIRPTPIKATLFCDSSSHLCNWRLNGGGLNEVGTYYVMKPVLICY